MYRPPEGDLIALKAVNPYGSAPYDDYTAEEEIDYVPEPADAAPPDYVLAAIVDTYSGGHFHRLRYAWLAVRYQLASDSGTLR